MSYKIILAMLITTAMLHSQEKFLDADDKKVSRLYTIGWFPVEHRLKFTIEVGQCKHPMQYETDKCKSEDVTINERIDYSIDIDNAEMYQIKMICTPDDFGGTSCANKEVKALPFSVNEATKVHQILDLLERYGIDSHVWYRMGGDKHKTDDVIAKKRRPVPPRVGIFETQVIRGFVKNASARVQ